MIKTIEKNSPKKKMLRVCAYIRVSTDNPEQLDSFETQEAHYKSLIKRNPAWKFVGIYSDEGISGTKTDGRFGLQEMMANSRAGKIDLILTKSLSRFARNTVDALSLIRELIKLGVCIRFEKENIDTSSMESELILSIMASLAEEESRSTSQNLKWSIKRSFENGTYLPNYLPYGYVYDGKEIVINDSEAEIVRFLFEESLNGKGGFRLAKDLNHRKIPPIRSKAWSDTTILGILKNEFYTGDVLCQKTYTDDHFVRHRNKGEKEQYLIKDHHPAIISHEVFNHVQEKIKSRRKSNVKKNKVYPFTGKLRCKECGDTYKRRIHSYGGDKSIHWTCRRHISSKDLCSQKSIKEYRIEWAFLTMLNKLIFAKDEILKPLLEQNVESRSRIDKKKAHRLREELQNIIRQLRTLDELKAKGLLNDKNHHMAREEALKEKVEKEREIELLDLNQKETAYENDGLMKLYRFTKKHENLSHFDDELFEKLVSFAEIDGRESITFHLVSGLRLKERF